MSKTITLTPNYNAIFDRFIEDARIHLALFADENLKVFNREQVYRFLISLRIAVNSMTNVDEIERLRDLMDGSEKVFALLNKEQDEEWERDVERLDAANR